MNYSFDSELKSKTTEFGAAVYREFISKECNSFEEFLQEYSIEKGNIYSPMFTFSGKEKCVIFIEVGVTSMCYIHIETKPALISIICKQRRRNPLDLVRNLPQKYTKYALVFVQIVTATGSKTIDPMLPRQHFSEALLLAIASINQRRDHNPAT